MALNRVDFPTIPNPVAGDWALLTELVSKSFQNINSPLQVDGSNIPQGTVFQIGGIIYHADSDTAITGTSSDYVKLTPNSGDGGATADASFVSSLTGVSWNKIYNGYYDTSGNLYIFNEARAVADGELAVSYTSFGDLWDKMAGQSLTSSDDVEFSSVQCASIDITAVTLAGVYTGSTASETNLPIGTIILVYTGSSNYNINQDIYPRVGTYDYSLTTGPYLSGTWRARGRVNTYVDVHLVRYILAQRTE